MAREVLYRRSFHSDRDLKGMESLLGMDRMMVARKVSVDMRLSTADGGFEAPRNSLDVPFSGLLEMRRNSEVRNEEIPIGYELSRSLTTRRRPEEYSTFKPLSSTNDPIHLNSKHSILKVNPELDHKHRAPSVVARLMGLDALPHQEKGESPKHSTLRRIEGAASSDVPALSSERDVWGQEHSKQKQGYGEFSFRNHPQEKQLQEFKREFTARQSLQGRHSMSSLNLEGFTLQQKKEELLRLEPQMDSEEFLDALNFLNANKDFFVKVLKDPHSSFAKHLQQPGGSFASSENGPGRQVGGKLNRSSLECDSLSFTDDLAEWEMRQDLRQNGVTADKSKAVRGPRWGRDEEMPGRSRWRARGGFLSSAGRMGPDQILPTRIVVLKPNLGKQAYGKLSSSTSSSPLLHSDRILKMRFEGKENLKQEMKERTQLRNDAGLAREHHRDDIKDGSRDARIIAKQIVKHVKEETSQRLVKDGQYTMDSFAPVSCLTGRKAAAQKGGGDASSLTDDGKIRSNLPSLSSLSKNEREREHRQVGFNGRRGSYTDDSKCGSNKNLTSSSKSFRESSKLDEGMLGNQDSCSKQSVRESKMLKKTGRSNSFKVRDSKCEAPRVLPRSLSAPAAASVENRALEGERKGGATVERATCLSKARPVENSPFKERLLSLKDSFSLTKRRGNKKLSSPQCSSPPDLSELSTPRQLTLEQVGAISHDRKEPCHLLPGFEWGADSSAKAVAKAALEKSLDAVQSDNSLIMQTPSGLQWPSNADLADTASETSLDKCEQPSPVSVLETPFQEESPSSVDKREMDSQCHELRCDDCKDLLWNFRAEFFSQPSSCHGSFDCLTDESLNTWNLPEAHVESYRSWEAACISGTEEEMTYIMHVLSLSGLNMNGLIMAYSLSPEHGLNPSVFGSLEAYYRNRSKGDIRDNVDVLPPLNTSSRRLLFDVVDEVVASTIKRRTLPTWAYGKSSNRKVVVCTGKQLLDEILAHISYHRYMPSEVEEEVLEDMASKDLMREAPWVPLQSNTQSVVTELERLLCGDLIREIVHECVRR